MTTAFFLKPSSLISIADCSRETLDFILQSAEKLSLSPHPELLKGTTLATCFFEPSTRTRLSFETAMLQAGGSCIGFSEAASTSVKKGESLSDTIRMISAYADIIALRHPLEGSARLASLVSDKPILNAGDGANQHPSQTLLDLFSILKCQGRLEGLHIALAGDLKFGRTIHSLSLALAHYGARLYFVSPESLPLPETIQRDLRRKGIKFSFHPTLESVIPKVDILYMTRIQTERFASIDGSFTNSCLLKKHHLEKAKPHLKILHPLPRVDEIEKAIDDTPFAYYFQQAAHGVVVRGAILGLFLRRLPW